MGNKTTPTLILPLQRRERKCKKKGRGGRERKKMPPSKERGEEGRRNPPRRGKSNEEGIRFEFWIFEF